MSQTLMDERVVDPDALETSVRTLVRDSLEGTRPLSELLGDALSELRRAARDVRALRAELERSRAPGRAGRADDDDGQDGPGIVPGLQISGRGQPAQPPETAPRGAVDLFQQPAPASSATLELSLRARVAGAYYLGTLRGGDRLPSIRELARWTGLNHKVVRPAYRALERSGFIEVRARSGIYISDLEPASAREPEPAVAWAADIVADAVRRGLDAGDLPLLLRRSVATRRLRCACVDSTEDDRYALCREVGDRFGLQTTPVGIAQGKPTDDLRSADLVVTTPFHAADVRALLAPTQPLVVVRLHPAWWQAVAEHDDTEPLRLLCVDRLAGDRLRHAFGPALAQRVRVVAVDRPSGGRAPELDQACLATDAAAARLNGDGAASTTLRCPPYLSPEAVRQLAHVLVALNLAAAPGSAPEPA